MTLPAGRFTVCGLAMTAAFSLAAGCGEGEPTATQRGEIEETATPEGTVLSVSAPKSGSGAYRFETRRLQAVAGAVRIHFRNDDTFPHNVRVQTGSKCCFKPGHRDVGGTETISGGTDTEATLTLEPGRYVFLCSIGSHYDGDTGQMRGRLTVSPANMQRSDRS